MKTGKAILAIVAGIAAGATLGALFAPYKGRKTRKKLIKKSADLAEAIDNRIDQKFNEYEKRMDDLLDILNRKSAGVRYDKDVSQEENVNS